MRDSDTLVVDIRLPDSTPVFGLNIDWQSNDPAVLEVREITSPGGPLQDSLTLRLRAQAVAHARGIARVRVVASGSSAFQPLEHEFSFNVYEHWIAASAGLTHSCALTIDQQLYCWGDAATGALGDGSTVQQDVPTRVLGIGSLTSRTVSAGADNTCADLLQGVLSCWGHGTFGRLGTGSELDQFLPATVLSGRLFQSVSSGTHSCGITDTFIAFCWGEAEYGQLGAFKSLLFPLDQCADGTACSLKPIAVRSSSRDTLHLWVIDVGAFHTCGIVKAAVGDSAAKCWGKSPAPVGTDRVFVLGDTIPQSDTAIAVASTLTFGAISAGGQHTCALTAGGSAYCWGGNGRGQLGTGSPQNEARPKAVLTNLHFIAITVGDSHSCALTALGVAYCWGANDFGQLGIDSTSRPSAQIPTPVLGDHQFQKIAAGDFHTCAVTVRGAAYCWGRGSHDELGADSTRLQNCQVGTSNVPCSRFPLRVSEP